VRPSYYAVIPSEVRYDNRLRPSEKLLYGEITCLCNKTGRCWAENQYFANLYDVNKKTVSSWVSNLQKLGYIGVNVDKKDNNKRYLSIKSWTPIHKKMDTYPQKNGGIYNNIYNTKKNNKINIPIEFFIKTWNKTFDSENVSSIINIKGARLNHVKKRWQENPDEKFFVDYFNKIHNSDFLSGRSADWRCSFDWVMNPSNMQKILEGNYNNEEESWLDKLRSKHK
jgi:hypothetical protein